MRRRGWMLAGFLVLLPTVAQAAMFMLVDGVTGPSKTANYGGWFNVESAAWGIERAKTAEPFSFVVTLRSSAGVATLIQLSASNAIAKRIVLDHVAAVDATYLVMQRLTCEEPVIRSSNVSGHADDSAIVQLKIQCSRFTWENFDYNAQRTLAAQGKGSWNFKTNTP